MSYVEFIIMYMMISMKIKHKLFYKNVHIYKFKYIVHIKHKSGESHGMLYLQENTIHNMLLFRRVNEEYGCRMVWHTRIAYQPACTASCSSSHHTEFHTQVHLFWSKLSSLQLPGIEYKWLIIKLYHVR